MNNLANVSLLRVLVIAGTRPEAIKLAPVIRELQRHPDRVCIRTCVTAQHREMLDEVLRLFGIVPDVDLDLMRPGQTLSQLASRVLERLEPILQTEHPDWILVQGDTTTVMAAALAAHHQRIRIGHVEAGLRTADKWNPFPEEMNRVIADHLSDLCFAPTERARKNLVREGIAQHAIRVTGNTIVDALMQISNYPSNPEPIRSLYPSRPDARLILVTAHRRESFGAPLERICQALETIARQGAGKVHVVYPVHPNPNVQEPVYRLLGHVPHVTLIPPIDYVTMIQIMRRSYIILTDSGGIQEEAPSFGVPVLILREVTERPEATEAGVARIVGTDPQRIVTETLRLLDDSREYETMARAVNPFGDGHAAERIREALVEFS